MRFAAIICVAGLLPALVQACSAESGPRTAALVELYTSEGCSSCPPAERWLASLARKGYPAGSLVPLALHVDYWDYIGWKDPFARKDISARQRNLTLRQKNALVYTPQVMLQGRDFRAWGTAAFEEALARIHAQPARAHIALRIHGASADALEVEASAEARGQADAALYVAAYASRLESAVGAGKNRGRLLLHDFVALEWRGPIALEEGAARSRLRLALLPGARAVDSGVAAFVQSRRTGEVLQALMRPYCGG